MAFQKNSIHQGQSSEQPWWLTEIKELIAEDRFLADQNSAELSSERSRELGRRFERLFYAELTRARDAGWPV